MKYTYAYKTSDGVRHEASIDAESREAVFVALRVRGIKAIKVVATDGSKANGEIRVIHKRGLVVSVIVAAILAAVFVNFFNLYLQPPISTDFLTSQTRRQLVGDTVIIEKGIRTGWADVFELEGDRFLASFAIPGIPAAIHSTTIEKLTEALQSQSFPKDTKVDSIEARQIMAMVAGMKLEALAYLAAGGSLVEYGKRLTERQDAEIAIYERAKREIENAKKELKNTALIEFWEHRNDELRNLGIKLIPLED